jgi:hypothetical protein
MTDSAALHGPLSAYIGEPGEDDHSLILQLAIQFNSEHQYLFTTNYLPFENSGVLSEWQLELPANPSKIEPAQFDYDTISDVNLRIRYTVREGGGVRNAAIKSLAQAAGSVRLFSIRHEFPTEWAKFRSAKIEGDEKIAELAWTLREDHLPLWSKGRLKSLRSGTIFAKTSKASINVTEKAYGSGEEVTFITLNKNPSFGDLLVGTLKEIPLPTTVEDTVYPQTVEFKFKLNFDDNTMEDLWLAVTWEGK